MDAVAGTGINCDPSYSVIGYSIPQARCCAPDRIIGRVNQYPRIVIRHCGSAVGSDADEVSPYKVTCSPGINDDTATAIARIDILTDLKVR